MLSTIQAAASQLRQGQLTSVDLVDFCLDRIDRLEAKVRAWVLVDRDGARTAAKELTAEAKRGQWRGPLHGIPIAIKDIIDVFDWPTAGGSRLWAQSIARQDATVVRRLLTAGAVLLGKTVTTAYASFDPPPTRNPWNLTRTPGGSSSGSAAALACGMCFGAMGSQTGGSITRPASFCGVAGCKPTYCRVSVHGIMPLAHSMDHPGPMARSVRDLALMLQIIAGADALDPDCSSRPVADLTVALSHSLPKPRLGRVRGLFSDLAEPPMNALMDQVSEQLRKAGAFISEVALPANFSDVLPRHRTIMAVEAAQYHEPRLRKHPDDYPPSIRQLLEEGLATTAPEYARCKEHQARLKLEMLGCFSEVDALLTPATRGPAPDAGTTGDPAFNSPWSYTGLPTISLPAGWSVDGMPLAIQLVGMPWSEAQLFAAAAWCEDVLDVEKRDPLGV